MCSWDLMVDTFLDEGAESVGLGKMQIIILVIYVLASLGLIIAFVLVTLMAWAQEDNVSRLTALCPPLGDVACS